MVLLNGIIFTDQFLLIFSNSSRFREEAKNRKQAADRESNPLIKVNLYSEAVIYFLLAAAAVEQHKNNESSSLSMYKDILDLIE